MPLQDLHELPKFRDGWSSLYVEHARIDREDRAIALHDAAGRTPVPCAQLALLMLGPGTTITHDAVGVLADCGCLVAWCGEEGVRFYASGAGETRSSRNFLRQVRAWADPGSHGRVVRKMYALRFDEVLSDDLAMEQIRGIEGARVRMAYQAASAETGVPWTGRNYDRSSWKSADPVNRALSSANACLYGLCHAAIVALGFSPALGFVHTGKMLSFVYDVADLYKAEISIPLAFRVAASEVENVERAARIGCRDLFRETRLLDRLPKDLDRLFEGEALDEEADFDGDAALPGALWDGAGSVPGGVGYGGGSPGEGVS